MNAVLSNKTLSILNEDKRLFTDLQALSTGLKVPGSDSLMWMNKQSYTGQSLEYLIQIILTLSLV